MYIWPTASVAACIISQRFVVDVSAAKIQWCFVVVCVCVCGCFVYFTIENWISLITIEHSGQIYLSAIRKLVR